MHGKQWSDTISKMFDYLNYYTIALLAGLVEASILTCLTVITILAHLAAAFTCKVEVLARHLAASQDAISARVAELGANLQKWKN